MDNEEYSNLLDLPKSFIYLASNGLATMYCEKFPTLLTCADVNFCVWKTENNEMTMWEGTRKSGKYLKIFCQVIWSEEASNYTMLYTRYNYNIKSFSKLPSVTTPLNKNNRSRRQNRELSIKRRDISWNIKPQWRKNCSGCSLLLANSSYVP